MRNHLFDALFACGAEDSIALTCGAEALTYADLSLETARWAAALEALNVEPGDRVAAQVDKSLGSLILYLATVRIGAVYLPLNTAYTLAELTYFIGDAEPALVVCDPSVTGELETIAQGAEVVGLDADGRGELWSLAQTDLFAPPVPRGPDDLAAICYTSGTTGRSKGAMLSHGALASNAATLTDLWRFTPRDVLIHALPTYHVHGLFVATHVALMSGASMIFQPRFEPGAVIAAMPAASAFMGVPTHYTRLLADPRLTREAAAGMRLFVSGSAPLLAQTHAAWRARTGHAILERYGMTETGMNASNPYDGDRRPGTVGFPLPDVALRVVAEEGGETLPAGEIGVIEVKGPNVCAGYWRNPEKTAEAFRPDGFFVTGDLGSFDADGYLTIVGRDKDLIITGGLNVYPKEVEAEIDAFPGVVESAVIGLPHPDFGEAVTAVVAVGAGGEGDLTEAAVIAALSERLARFKQPKRVLFVADLPRNAMGKVQKAALRAQHAALYSDPVAAAQAIIGAVDSACGASASCAPETPA
jgi:malonyl-CoA/methylmalonyl-CoA synthetase